MEFNFGDIVTNGNITGQVVSKRFHCVGDTEITYTILSEQASCRFTETDKEDKTDRHSFLCELAYNGPKHINHISPRNLDYKEFKCVGNKELPEAKFKIGDSVSPNKTGPINIGKICGYYPGTYELLPTNNVWTQLYPDWTDKTIYCIQLNKPNLTFTKEAYLSQNIGAALQRLVSCLTEDGARYVFNTLDYATVYNHFQDFFSQEYNKLEPVNCMTAPEDDLSLLSDILDDIFEEKHAANQNT